MFLPSWEHHPHFPLGNGDQLTPPWLQYRHVTQTSQISVSYLSGHSDWFRDMVQNEIISPSALRELLAKRCSLFPGVANPLLVCQKPPTEPAQSLPDDKANQEENGPGVKHDCKEKERGERKFECWVLLSSLCSGYKLGGQGGSNLYSTFRK